MRNFSKKQEELSMLNWCIWFITNGCQFWLVQHSWRSLVLNPWQAALVMNTGKQCCNHLSQWWVKFEFDLTWCITQITRSRHRNLQNIRIPILQIFVFVYWKKYFGPIKMFSCPPSINKNKDLENWNSNILEGPMSWTSYSNLIFLQAIHFEIHKKSTLKIKLKINIVK